MPPESGVADAPGPGRATDRSALGGVPWNPANSRWARRGASPRPVGAPPLAGVHASILRNDRTVSGKGRRRHRKMGRQADPSSPWPPSSTVHTCSPWQRSSPHRCRRRPRCRPVTASSWGRQPHLIAGSDGRQGPAKARAEEAAHRVHRKASAPTRSRSCTSRRLRDLRHLVSIPRDSWVGIPGHGPGKDQLGVRLRRPRSC